MVVLFEKTTKRLNWGIMVVYVLPTILSILLALVAKRFCQCKIIYWFSALPLFLVAALRAWTGTDWVTYYYNQTQDILSGVGAYLEPAYRILMLFSMKVLHSYQFSIAVIAFAVFFFTWKCFARYSEHVAFSIFAFVTLACFYFSLNAMRQAVAIAIFCYACQFILERKSIKYFACIFFAITCHFSALIYVPFYFILKMKISKKHFFIVSIGLLFFLPIISKFIFPLIMGKYSAYFAWGTESSYNFRYLIPLSFMLVQSFYLQKKGMFVENRNDVNLFKNLTILAFWGCLLAPCLTGQSAFRFIAFFLPGACVYWAHLFVHSNLWLKILSIVLGCIVFFYITALNPGWILPYHSFFDDYKMSYTEFQYRIYQNQE